MNHNRRVFFIVTLPMIALCLACALSALASQVIAARLTRPVANVTPMCAWVRRGRAGVWWSTNVAPGRAFANSHRYNAVCLAIPWAETLPNGGRIAVDVAP